MKTARISFLLCVALSTGFRLWAQDVDKFSRTASQLKYTFAKHHFSPLPFDDAFSERVFRLFGDYVDPYHSYLLASQWDSLRVYEHTLDNELNGENPGQFLAHFGRMYRARWQRMETLMNGYYAKPLIFTTDEIYVLEHEKSSAFTNEKEWQTHWYKKFKFSVLTHIAEGMGNTPAGTAPDAAREARSRAFMQKVYTKRAAKVLAPKQGYERMLSDIFFNAVAMAHDPHSMYIPAQEKDSYDQELNAVKMSYGIDVDENENGEFYVLDVIPGSAAWYSGSIKADDVLVRWIQADKDEVDFIDLSANEVWEMFSDNEEETLTLVVKAQNGPERTVTLKKELLRAEEELVKSWILHGEKKIGYISLPGFYFNWFEESPSSCAEDVAREILKMRNEQIDGLILDVRDNGGGSLGEAVEMAGIFISEGPLVYTWEQGQKPQVTKDPNRGTVYDGPMILMVNGESASASEVLADILQDYNRALIVGAPTFGKASMQITLPLDSLWLKLPEELAYMSMPATADYANVTSGKLYRVTGKNHQAYGLTPDIQIPDFWSMAYPKEADYPYMLPADSIKGSSYLKPLPPLPVAELRQKSVARTSTEHPFTAYTQRAPEVKKLVAREDQTFPLKWDKFMAYYRESEKAWDEIDSLSELPSNPVFEVRLNAFNALSKIGDVHENEWQVRMQTYIAGDPQLMEAYRIMKDYIAITENKK